MKYLALRLCQLICWSLIAYYGSSWWNASKNGDGMYVCFIVAFAAYVILVTGRTIAKVFKKQDATLGDFTLEVDEYEDMRRRFREDREKR